MLLEDRMPEAEVTLRLAMFLINNAYTSKDVICAVDGAQVQVGENIIFPIIDFLSANGWHRSKNKDAWQGAYVNNKYPQKIVIHSAAGEGDLVSELKNGCRLRVESKKGPLIAKRNSQEYPLVREAIGQLMTAEHVRDSDILAVAIPESEKFISLAKQWRTRPLMKQVGIHIITINRSNKITGLESFGL
ncbi:hypothetical protein ACJJIK_13280 [Microbulbifer sp. ZKSA006]|uniref:hypothetical protein n=1 Tax=Microbulbifer sp. ZKSA006 TaxID=3243390 RepID=UPI0040399867